VGRPTSTVKKQGDHTVKRWERRGDQTAQIEEKDGKPLLQGLNATVWRSSLQDEQQTDFRQGRGGGDPKEARLFGKGAQSHCICEGQFSETVK